MAPRLFVFGMGYSALALARRVAALGWQVAGTTRSADKAAALRAAGIEPFLFDRDRPLDDPAAALADATHILSTVPPDERGDAVLDHHASDIATLQGLVWAAYLSTTGVYGDTAGAWVDEDAPLRPVNARSAARVTAERRWLRLPGVPTHVFRLPGIYGPGRSAIDALRAGTARRIDKPGQVFSRIHVEDIAGGLLASMQRPHGGAVYNLTDNEAAPTPDVVAFAAELIGMPVPPIEPFDPAGMSPMAASFYAECKRVRNDRIKRETGWRPLYPTYREGLRAQADAEGGTAAVTASAPGSGSPS